MTDNMDEPEEEYLLADYVKDVHMLSERALEATKLMGILLDEKDKAALLRLRATKIENLADSTYVKIAKERDEAREKIAKLDKKLEEMEDLIHDVSTGFDSSAEDLLSQGRQLRNDFRRLKNK